MNPTDESNKDPNEISADGGTPETADTPKADAVMAKSGEKKSKKADSEKPKESLFAEVSGEFKKIVWPTRRELAKQTTTVLFVSLMFGVIIFLMDLMFGFGINTLIDVVLG